MQQYFGQYFLLFVYLKNETSGNDPESSDENGYTRLQKEFLKTSPNSQENTCVGVSLLIKLQAEGKKATPVQVLFCEYLQNF